MEITLNQENFESEVIKSQIPILVDFWAKWCGPCLAIAPALTEIAGQYQGKASVGKLNVDEFKDIAMRYQVRGIPNLKIFKNGQIVDEIVGSVPKSEITKKLDRHVT